ncbi:RTA1-like protein [Mycena indigotica]|uniref:RTA1-like protein n=1 Tax=Mycena indigotica TaxID=2126181 RepID=A0A8H6W708_9AGAR|nr:RTA1-like protein [Mycena indigotica]KAF7303978.1 RTA1-like protein [Mycena indigotica]
MCPLRRFPRRSRSYTAQTADNFVGALKALLFSSRTLSPFCLAPLFFFSSQHEILNSDSMSNSTIHSDHPISSPYGYVPSRGVAVIFLILFGLSTAAHLGQAIMYRMWWLFPTAFLCGLGELTGWSGRLWSSISPREANPYMMQITTTIISPTPLIAVNFIVLGHIIRRLGPCYSRLSPRNYTRIFLSCDLVALLIQGAGGGIAASSNPRKTGSTKTQELGGHIMLVGIIFQLVALCVYSFLGVQFIRNYRASRPVRPMISSAERGILTQRVRLMLWALTVSTSVLLIRGVYRTIELADGWTGEVITTEFWFNMFDGGMVIVAIWTINIAHPGLLLSAEKEREGLMLKQISSSTSLTSLAV